MIAQFFADSCPTPASGHDELRDVPGKSNPQMSIRNVSYSVSVSLQSSIIVNNILYFRSGYGIPIGQNLAWGYSNWDAAIQGWFDEVKDFTFGVGSKNGKPVGHYTQVKFAKLITFFCAGCCPFDPERTIAETCI